ncbi:hypothetical protein J1N35_015707 [Gossypium stocksii]|uniref:Uncharacterized protein n=1 Tax=Gossypium stocksii TaxID=47602 RepID=A0A9D3VZ48_9ROSI|nr:hypothetical protein J1N35_015707 [Gossypium stocksii]
MSYCHVPNWQHSLDLLHQSAVDIKLNWISTNRDKKQGETGSSSVKELGLAVTWCSN